MAKNSKKQFDFQKEWEKTRQQLTKISKEAAVLAKKGEKEILKASKVGKLHIDSSAALLKKEHLYLQVGKEYVKSSGRKTVKIKKLVEELNNLDSQIMQIKDKLKTSR